MLASMLQLAGDTGAKDPGFLENLGLQTWMLIPAVLIVGLIVFMIIYKKRQM